MVWTRLRSFLKAAVARHRFEHEMDTELQFHLDARVDDLVASGLDPAEAIRQARLELGAPDRWKEEGREARGLQVLDQLWVDVRYGVRGLRRSPAFAAAAVLSIALGIGANGAIFSLVNAVLFRLMPVEDPTSLVLLSQSNDTSGLGGSFPYPFYRQLTDTATSLAGVMCRASMSPSVDIDGAAERVRGELVSGNYFDVLGVRPHIGRLLSADDDRVPGAHPVVVLSHGYWQRRFGSDPLVVGRTIRINQVAMTVIGVTPPTFQGIELGAFPDMRVPMAMQAEMYASHSRLDNPREWWLQVMGRVRSGVERSVAEQEVDSAFQQFMAVTHPDRAETTHVTLLDGSRGRPTLQTRFATPLVVLSGLAASALLLVCLNVANLMLARAATRRREISIRLAVGARRGRVVGQLLVESLLVAVTGGVLGLLMAQWGARVLATIAVPTPTGAALETSMDWRVLAFVGTITMVTGVACGLAPALAASRTGLGLALRADNRQLVGGRFLAREVLVAAQIALSFTLLVGAGLFARSLANLQHQDFGFATEHLLQLTLDPTLSGYDDAKLRAFYDEATERVGAVPGVQATSLGMLRLLGQNLWGSGLILDTGVRDNAPGPHRNAVGPGYFASIGTPIVAGREFTRTDRAGSPKVAIVNEAFARRYFDGQALGRRIGTGCPEDAADFTIVGIARDGKYAQVRETIGPFWYAPYEQLATAPGQLTLHVRARGEPDALAAEVRRTIAAIDPYVTVFGLTTARQQIAEQLAMDRVLALLATTFAGLAVLLAALGLYGVMTYSTIARTREIGLRIALGATPASILRLVLRQTMLVTVLGLGCGVLIALVGVRFVRSLLFGIEPTDPVAMAIAALAVVLVATVAAWLPARRAARVNPTIALQQDV